LAFSGADLQLRISDFMITCTITAHEGGKGWGTLMRLNKNHGKYENTSGKSRKNGKHRGNPLNI
jgi:hypothetical protein